MFWSLKHTEITSFSKRQKFYFIVLLQVFCSMTARQSSPTENWRERELTERDLWIKHIKPLCTAVKPRACCWQDGFACLCAFAGKWRCLSGESASQGSQGSLPPLRPCHPTSSSLSSAQPGARQSSCSPQWSTSADSAPSPSQLFYPWQTSTSEIVMHL